MNGVDETNAARFVRGIVAGAVAGAAASFAMDRFQAAWTALTSSRDADADDGEPSQPATVKAADAVAKAVAGRPVPKPDEPLAGQAVHYALGIGLGIAYAIAAEYRPAVTAGYGTAFGLGTATVLDEAIVPAVGLGEAPWKSDVGTTFYGVASHLVFGVAAEAVRRSLRATLVA
ncbi:putative membrane protein [Sphingomonas jinjuensis]|uniref:Putative membrane protein n=1 Tax=Sphingomonas jinjuensis TaxID=535907 RepID=A0A840F3K2_9SPHN|nr:putative membrane protein [Sphingomonas jinjuensis]